MRKTRLPGEYLKISTVTLEMDSLDAEIFAPEKLHEAQQKRRNYDQIIILDHWIVSTRELDKKQTITFEHNGETIAIPTKVLDRANDQRKAIVKERRRDSARLHAAQRQRRKAGEQDFEEDLNEPQPPGI